MPNGPWRNKAKIVVPESGNLKTGEVVNLGTVRLE
jgi:hypothetical protein